MAKERFDRSKPHVNIGTIGSISNNTRLIEAIRLTQGKSLYLDFETSTLSYNQRGLEPDCIIIDDPIASMDYSEMELMTLAMHTKLRPKLDSEGYCHTFSTSSLRSGKNWVHKELQRQVATYFESHPIKTLVPINVYRVINNC